MVLQFYLLAKSLEPWQLCVLASLKQLLVQEWGELLQGKMCMTSYQKVPKTFMQNSLCALVVTFWKFLHMYSVCVCVYVGMRC